ncbi:DUF397 domain-containing protein [Micromonospora sp. WMMA1363]|uniref:DUF397 domain-containing protein n=1 Tax=Micromonospora sp. WMMA1363 TaxID=3053985 RepID=UPI00259D0B76|nr:DUF397 domain-containing protein [Micromonospora sp. WMMA1363]MDM4718355.1 DUF397 domain-containing protein [Micromonospora sp. WMMA1363]
MTAHNGGNWRISSRSVGNGNCVEVARVDGRIAVRDSKDRRGPVLAFPLPAWRTFVSGIDGVRAD